MTNCSILLCQSALLTYMSHTSDPQALISRVTGNRIQIFLKVKRILSVYVSKVLVVNFLYRLRYIYVAISDFQINGFGNTSYVFQVKVIY